MGIPGKTSITITISGMPPEQLSVRGLTFKTVISGGAIDPMELTSCRQSLSFLAGSGSVRIAGVCEEIIR